MKWIKENLKDLLLTICVLFAIFYVAAFAGVWGDRDYKTGFWPDFFMYSQIGIGILLIAGWAYYWFGGGNKKS